MCAYMCTCQSWYKSRLLEPIVETTSASTCRHTCVLEFRHIYELILCVYMCTCMKLVEEQTAGADC